MSSNDSTIQRLHKAIQQILLLRLNHTEIACLKTLILFRHGRFMVIFMGLCVHFGALPTTILTVFAVAQSMVVGVCSY